MFLFKVGYTYIPLKASLWHIAFVSVYAPINLELQHPPPLPRAYPGHLTVHRAWGEGNLNVALEGW